MKKVHTGADGMDVRRISTRLLRARNKDNYQETGILRLLDTLAFGEHLILFGDKGAGKTLNIEQWAHRNDVPFLRMGCTSETGKRELLGGFVLKSLQESWFSLGELAAAIDVANECGQCVLVLEEINALNAEAQKIINSVADYRREVTLNNIGLVLRLNEPVVAKQDGEIREVAEYGEDQVSIVVGLEDHIVPRRSLLPIIQEGAAVKKGDPLCEPAKLWVIGTMNPDYGGTYDLNEDFRSRFQFVQVDFMSDEVEAEILYNQFPGRVSATEKQICSRLQSLAKETRGGKYGYALSTRDLEQCVKTYLRFQARTDPRALEKALKVLQGKFPQRHAETFASRVRSVFAQKIDLNRVNIY